MRLITAFISGYEDRYSEFSLKLHWLRKIAVVGSPLGSMSSPTTSSSFCSTRHGLAPIV